MDISPLLLQSLGSLFAILLLSGLAWKLGLGGAPMLDDRDAVRAAAGEVEDGFEATRTSIARGSACALAQDAEGRIMLIKRHGNRFAGRVLDGSARVREEVDAIIVDCGDRRFAPQRLSLADPAYWVGAINRL